MKHRGNRAGFGSQPAARMTACLFWKPTVAVVFYTLARATQAFTFPQTMREVDICWCFCIFRRPTSQVAELLCFVYTKLMALRQACHVVIPLTLMFFEVVLNMSNWDSKPWSCTNSLLITSMAFDSGCIVTAGNQLGTGISGHTRLSVSQATSATRLGAHERPVPIQYSSSAAALLCRKRGLPRRSRTGADRTGLGGPGRCGQPTRMTGSLQEDSKGSREHFRATCLLEDPMVFCRKRALGCMLIFRVAAGDGGGERGGEDVEDVKGRCRKAASCRPPGRPPMQVI